MGLCPSQCSKSCGGGTRRRRAMCVNTYNDILDDSKCSQQEKLTVQRCSDFSCPQWKTGDWSEVGAGHQGGLTLLVLPPRGWYLQRGVSTPACLSWFICTSCRRCTERLQTGSKVIGLNRWSSDLVATGQVATFLPAKSQGVNVSPILQ